MPWVQKGYVWDVDIFARRKISQIVHKTFHVGVDFTVPTGFFFIQVSYGFYFHTREIYALTMKTYPQIKTFMFLVKVSNKDTKSLAEY